MSWSLVFRPEFRDDAAEAFDWYESRSPGLGAAFIDELIHVLEQIEENPLHRSRRHASKNIRWRFTDRFPYKVVYEIIEVDHTIIVAAVLHAARHDRRWIRRIDGN
jgi:plasmid stabilization system protein ParE